MTDSKGEGLGVLPVAKQAKTGFLHSGGAC